MTHFINTDTRSINVSTIMYIDWEVIVDNSNSQDLASEIQFITGESLYLYYNHEPDLIAIKELKRIAGYRCQTSRKGK